MGYSGSTPPRSPEPRLPLFLEVTGDDHPKACTGRRLLHRRLARPVPRSGLLRPAPVVLDPYAREPLSAEDREAARRGGVLAVDCSWNRLADRGRLPEEPRNPRAGRHRRLPILVAANPQHFGRVAELNTVEALSAALYLLGCPAQAAELLEGFRGGPGFLEINQERLAAYSRARDHDAVLALERDLFGALPAGSPAPPAGGRAPPRRGTAPR
ncbi:MAG TPA: DUF367 domain-containing protein [Thermoplasmata archaeon]|nr:DUF367 domain-containing protein [Thermoplasmata archaeon]